MKSRTSFTSRPERTKIHELISYYDQFYSEEGRPVRTSSGCYLPTDLRSAYEFFDALYGIGILEPHDVFVDAGSGDGRIAALASLFGLDALAVEGDQRIFRRAEKRIRELYKQDILPYQEGRLNLELVCGDFLGEQTYEKAGLCLDRVDHFFIAGDNERKLAFLIKNHIVHPYGATRLLLMCSNGERLVDILEEETTYRNHDGKYLGKVYQKLPL